jgi:predicted transcriptional regulator
MYDSDTLFIKVGIATLDQMRDRTLAIARGEHKRQEGEPKVWFTSFDALARIFSEQNMLLLETIRNSRPLSVDDLAQQIGLSKDKLLSELHLFERVGLIDMEVAAGGIQRPVPTRYTKVTAEADVGRSKLKLEAEFGAAAA